MALRCLNAAIAEEKGAPMVRQRIKEFQNAVLPVVDSLPSKVKEVLKFGLDVLA